MLVSSNNRVAVLLLILTQSFNFTFASNETSIVEAFAKVMPRLTSLPWINGIESARISSERACAKEIEAYLAAFGARELWALEMLDASSKVQSGILQGNVVDLGMYKECIESNGRYNNVDVRGKHCMVRYNVESLELTSSVCLPSSCNDTHAFQIASSMFGSLSTDNSMGIKITVTSALCTSTESEDFSKGEILTIAFFTAIASLMLLCAICDLVKRTWPQKMSAVGAVNTLAKFSFYTNGLALFDTTVKPGTITSINGIRFLSTTWIVALHYRSMTFMTKPHVDSWVFLPWLASWSATWYHMATFGTDNFFMISGFFTSYLFFKKVRSGGRINFPMMYLHRYIRLTPGVAVVGLFMGYVYHRIGNGPQWEIYSPSFTSNCKKYWWTNILYIQNFFFIRSICLPQSWFLATDMQLFLMTPIILYLLHRWPKYGFGVLSVLLLSTVAASALVIGLNRYSIVGCGVRESMSYYYIRPYTRAFPYLLAILLAYDMVTKKRQLTKAAIILGWIVACILISICCVAMHRLKTVPSEYDPAFEIVCAVFVRPCWTIAMAWIIYACSRGHGGLLARFLSLPIFVPLSRISFGIYLVHMQVVLFRRSSSTIPGILLEPEFFDDFMATMIWSAVISGAINLFVETPVLILENILRPSLGKRYPAIAMTDVKLQVGDERQK